LVTCSTALPPQIGGVGGGQRRQPRPEALLLAGQALDRVVDEGDRDEVAAPVNGQLDRLVGDLPLRHRRRPDEVVGRRPLRLARENLAEVVLGDDDRPFW
jgi:hypothetical protein